MLGERLVRRDHYSYPLSGALAQQGEAQATLEGTDARKVVDEQCGGSALDRCRQCTVERPREFRITARVGSAAIHPQS